MLKELGPCPPELNSMGARVRGPHAIKSQGRVGRGPGMQALLEAGEPREGHLANESSGQGHRLLQTDQPRSVCPLMFV